MVCNARDLLNKKQCNICIVDFMAKVCDECGMQFKDNAELGVHMRQNHQKFYCGVCRKEFDNEVELKNHVKTIHGLASNALA
jgi:hypothetical protein